MVKFSPLQILTAEGIQMTSQDYWRMFLDTGAPEMYLLFNYARKMEISNVYNNPGPGASGHEL